MTPHGCRPVSAGSSGQLARASGRARGRCGRANLGRQSRQGEARAPSPRRDRGRCRLPSGDGSQLDVSGLPTFGGRPCGEQPTLGPVTHAFADQACEVVVLVLRAARKDRDAGECPKSPPLVLALVARSLTARGARTSFSGCRQPGVALALKAPSKTVTGRPVIVTRSPFNSTPTSPERGDACRPTSDVRPSRAAQNGASTVCELPVTGSSGTPAFGAKRRERKSNSCRR